jgi:hypothetical protein
MRAVPTRVLLVVGAVGALALAAAALAARVEPVQWDGPTLLMSVLLAAMTVMTRLMPVTINPKTKTTAATVPLFAAALLLPAVPAVVVAAVGAIAAEAARRVRWFQAVFNTGEAMLRTATGSATFAVITMTAGHAGDEAVTWLVAAIAAATIMYVINVVLVEGLVAVQLLHFAWSAFWRRRRHDAGLEAPMFLAGLALAVAGDRSPPAILAVVPALLIARGAFGARAGLVTSGPPRSGPPGQK